MVVTTNVEARAKQAGQRWYEIRREAGVYTVHQQGTFSPDDGVNRWMGSVAQDGFGNIALGYSVSDTVAVKPGIRYTGRLAGDPPNVMTLGEANLAIGSGVQNFYTRWGDYSSMNVDPVDDCTFWYTNEYFTATSEFLGNVLGFPFYQTRIGSFSLPGCVDHHGESKGKKSKGKNKSGKRRARSVIWGKEATKKSSFSVRWKNMWPSNVCYS